MIEYIRSEVRT